jgi:putative RNA 2'-phosphotransferase
MGLDERDRVRLSKTMSYALRHRPREFHLVLDPEGFVSLEELLIAIRARRPRTSMDDLMEVVASCEKGRFEIVDGDIRACYGHSVEGKIEHEAVVPPEVLYHGTPRKALDGIRKDGLRPMGRQYVHLTLRRDFAENVGRRRDPRPAILVVEAFKAHQDGIEFYRANENFYLADKVPARYIIF